MSNNSCSTPYFTRLKGLQALSPPPSPPRGTRQGQTDESSSSSGSELDLLPSTRATRAGGQKSFKRAKRTDERVVPPSRIASQQRRRTSMTGSWSRASEGGAVKGKGKEREVLLELEDLAEGDDGFYARQEDSAASTSKYLFPTSHKPSKQAYQGGSGGNGFGWLDWERDNRYNTPNSHPDNHAISTSTSPNPALHPSAATYKNFSSAAMLVPDPNSEGEKWVDGGQGMGENEAQEEEEDDFGEVVEDPDRWMRGWVNTERRPGPPPEGTAPPEGSKYVSTMPNWVREGYGKLYPPAPPLKTLKPREEYETEAAWEAAELLDMERMQTKRPAPGNNWLGRGPPVERRGGGGMGRGRGRGRGRGGAARGSRWKKPAGRRKKQ